MSSEFSNMSKANPLINGSMDVSHGKFPGVFFPSVGVNEAGIIGFNPLQGVEVSNMLLEFLGKLAPPSILSGIGLDLKGKVASMFGSAKG